LSVTFAPELREAVREAADEAGLSLSEWLAQAAEAKIRADGQARILEEAERERRRRGLREFLDEYQAEHGAFTDEEMARARRWRELAEEQARESRGGGPDWPGRSATSQWNRSPAKTGCGPENSLAGLACGTRSTLASLCSRDLATGCLPVMLATCGGCATRREAGPWWSIADGGDGVPARVRIRGVGMGGGRSIGLGR
jgi:hypothetical protein